LQTIKLQYMNALEKKMGNYEQEMSGIHEEDKLFHKSKCLE